MKLTKDEKMMALLYGDGTRTGLIKALREMRSVLQEDEQELKTMTDGFLSKLKHMTDSEFGKVTKG